MQFPPQLAQVQLPAGQVHEEGVAGQALLVEEQHADMVIVDDLVGWEVVELLCLVEEISEDLRIAIYIHWVRNFGSLYGPEFVVRWRHGG